MVLHKENVELRISDVFTQVLGVNRRGVSGRNGVDIQDFDNKVGGD